MIVISLSDDLVSLFSRITIVVHLLKYFHYIPNFLFQFSSINGYVYTF